MGFKLESKEETMEPYQASIKEDNVEILETKSSAPLDQTPEPETESSHDTTDYTAKSPTQTTFSDYLRIFSYTTPLERIFLCFAVLGEIGTGATMPLMQIVFGHLTGSFAEYFIPGSTVTKQQFQKGVNHQTLYILYLFIARWVLAYYSMLTFRALGLRISSKIRLRYLTSLFALPIASLDTLPSGLASNTITTSSNLLQVGISDKLGTGIQSTSMTVSSLVVAFRFSWKLTLVTSTAIIFIVLIYSVLVPITIRMMKEMEFAEAKAAGVAGEVLGSVRVVVANGAEERIGEKYKGWVEESQKRGLKTAKVVGAQYAPVFFSVSATTALGFWYGFKLYSQGHIDNVGDIVIVLMSLVMLTTAIGQTVAPMMAASKAASAAADFFAIIDAPKLSVSGLQEPDASAREDIHFESVTFAYPSRAHVKVLDDLGITFEAGKITAIVGASGSGKSTIVGLLERWYNLDNERLILPASAIKPNAKDKINESDPEVKSETTEEPKTPVVLGGSISIGKHKIDDLDLKWWRSQIGLVQQEPFIFNDTIAKNVSYGLIGSKWENENAAAKQVLVEQACKEAFADEFIDKLPLKYETQVGDAGIKLSGGQRQRLAIARSIIKRPKILILDEATSSIDVRGEKLVQAALDKVSEGRTTITIAHRLSTIKKADKIVVLRKGKIVETGTHDGLLENKEGAYWALVNAQQLSMDDETILEESEAINLARAETLKQVMSSTDGKTEKYEELVYKPKSLSRSFGLLLYEQLVHWPWYLTLLAACVMSGGAYPLQSYLTAQLIQVVTKTGQAFTDAVNHWSLILFIVAIATGVAYFFIGWSAQYISTYIQCHYRQEYFESIIAKPIPFFDEEDNSSGTLAARLANDPTQLQQLLGMNMALVVSAMLGGIGCILVGFALGWKLTLVVLSVSLPFICGGAYFRTRYEIQFEKMNNEVFAESSKFAAESISAFRTVTSLTLEDMICRRYEVLMANHVKKAFKKSTWTTLVFSASDSVALLCTALGFWYGGTLLASREYSPVMFFVVYLAITNGASQAGAFLSFGPNIAQATAAANRILSLRARPKPPSSSSGKLPTPELTDLEGGVKIEFKDVWFKYPTRDIPILTGLNLTIEKGQFAALVGASGCGKTSIVSLLERFYSIQKGQILLNGTDISTLDPKTYRKSLSLVAQEPTLFAGTITSNILLGVPTSTSTSALHQACRDAEIHDFILSLPDGYNTEVGSKGVSLSGGQKQRMAIARALIREPKILLLDEATSSLDSESERLVQAAIERVGKGRTMVVVAHRLATVQNADVIFVLGDGGLLEVGTHAELLGKRGAYYSMCQSQALDR